MSQQRTSVVLIDDHPVVRSGIAAVLADESNLEVVGEAASAKEAIELFQRVFPNVALMDLMLPDGNGIDLISVLRTLSPQTQFVILTARVGAGDLARALAAGAHGYLFKNAPCDELIRAIGVAARGGTYVSPEVGRDADATRIGADLTMRELEVLRGITRGHATQRIAADLSIGNETVRSHTKHVLQKLGVQSRGQAAALSLKLGIVQADEL